MLDPYSASDGSMLKVALFDLDGTLVDTEGQYSVFWGGVGRRFKPEIPDFDQLIKGTTLKQIFSRHFPSKEEQDQILPLLEAFESRMEYEFFPGVREFITDLHRNGVKCAIVTSSDRKKMSNVYRAIPDFNDLFDAVLTAEDFSESKPSPDCYLRGAARFGADISECVVFEDAYNGLAAGMASGIYTIGLPTGHTREEIESRCNEVIDGFEGLTYLSLSRKLSAWQSVRIFAIWKRRM